MSDDSDYRDPDFVKTPQFRKIYGNREFRGYCGEEFDERFLLQWRETLDKLRESLRRSFSKILFLKSNQKLFDRLEELWSDRALRKNPDIQVDSLNLQCLILDKIVEVIEGCNKGDEAEELGKMWKTLEGCPEGEVPHLADVFHEIGLSRRGFTSCLDPTKDPTRSVEMEDICKALEEFLHKYRRK